MTLVQDLNRIASTNTVSETTSNNDPSIDGAQIVTSALHTNDQGVIVSWFGRGSVSALDIETALVSAGFDAALAPEGKALPSILGTVMRGKSNKDYSIKRRTVPRLDKETGTRAWCSRWEVARLKTSSDVGESAGSTALVAMLRDDSSDVIIRTDSSDEMEALGETIRREFNHIRDTDLLTAGQFTTWLSSTLIYRFASARVGAMGWFVPSTHKDRVRDLITAIRPLSGRGWCVADITTSEGLLQSVMDSFAHEVDEMETALNRERDAALAKGKDDVSERVAQRYVTALRELSDRAIGYAAMCGSAAVAETVQKVTDMKLALERVLGTGAGLRFSLLELDHSPEHELDQDDHMGVAQRRADDALQARRAVNGEPSQEDVPWYTRPDGLPPGVVEQWPELAQA
jgi:hypothetical protein